MAKERQRRRKVIIKRGLAIEPDAGLDEVAHIYQVGNDRYTATLSKIDVSSNQNSFYKIQLLESDDLSKYWVFISWGRIGTDVDGKCNGGDYNLAERQKKRPVKPPNTWHF